MADHFKRNSQLRYEQRNNMDNRQNSNWNSKQAKIASTKGIQKRIDQVMMFASQTGDDGFSLTQIAGYHHWDTHYAKSTLGLCVNRGYIIRYQKSDHYFVNEVMAAELKKAQDPEASKQSWQNKLLSFLGLQRKE